MPAQPIPVDFTITAQVTSSDLLLLPNALDFGDCPTNERTAVKVGACLHAWFLLLFVIAQRRTLAPRSLCTAVLPVAWQANRQLACCEARMPMSYAIIYIIS